MPPKNQEKSSGPQAAPSAVPTVEARPGQPGEGGDFGSPHGSRNKVLRHIVEV